MKKKDSSRLLGAISLVAISMLVSNNVIQFLENITKSHGIGVFVFILVMAFFNKEIARWFK